MTARLLLCLMTLWLVGATTIPSRPPAHGVRDTITKQELQPATMRKDQCYVVNNAGTAADCDATAGNGTGINICCSDGINWVAVGDGTTAGGGDITDVGPGCAVGACWTDGLATTGTVLLNWEGTAVDASDFTIIVPVDPGFQIDITMPVQSTVLVGDTTPVLSIDGDGLSINIGTLDVGGGVGITANLNDVSCDPSTTTIRGCLEQATQAEADAGTAGNLAVIASVLEAWNGGSNVVTVGTIATGVWNGTALIDAFVADTLTIDGSSTVAAGAVGADHIDAMSEIAAGIKRGPDATDTHLLTTDVAAPGALTCLNMDTDGSVVLAAGACAAAGGGDIDDVGPGCATGACWTDGVTTTGTILLNWEGTTANANDFTIIVPADPAAQIDITMPIVTSILVSNSVAVTSVQGAGLKITTGALRTASEEAFFIDIGSIAAANSGALVIDDDGNGTTYDLPTLNYQELALDLILFGVEAYPTEVDNACQVFRTGTDKIEWSTASCIAAAGAPALSDITDPVGDVSFTFTDGEAIDWVMTSTISVPPEGLFSITFDQPDDADGTDDIDVFEITITLESGDVGDTVRGFKIRQMDGTANTILQAAYMVENNETTAGTMLDAFRVISPGVDGGIVDALDVSAANITNALNMGANNIVTGTATIAAAELNRLDGLTGVIGTDGVAVVDLDGAGLLIGAGAINVVGGLGITANADDIVFTSTQVNDTVWGDNTEGSISWTMDASAAVDPILLFSGDPPRLDFNGMIQLDDGVGDSPSFELVNATNIIWSFQVLDADNNLDFRVSSATTETFVIRNTGAGNANVDIDGALTLGTPLADAEVADTLTIDGSSTVAAGAVGADHIDLMSEIAAGIKRGPDATDTHLLTTDVAAPGALTCLNMDTDGSVVLAAGACAAASGDVTDVGPGCATGACWTDGLATTGTILLNWEGTGVDGNDFTIIVPANPGAQIDITMPVQTTVLVGDTTPVLSIDGDGLAINIGTLDVGGGTCISANLNDVAITADCIDDAQVAANALDNTSLSLTLNLGAATSFEIPNSGAPVVDTLGEIAIDTTDVPVTDGVSQFLYNDGGEVVAIPGIKHACFDIENLLAADDNFGIWSPPYAVTIRGAYCYCNGVCTVAGTVHFEKNRAGVVTQIGGATPTGDVACSNSSAATEALTDLTSGTLTLQSFDQLRFDTITAPTATNGMNICFTFSVDRQ